MTRVIDLKNKHIDKYREPNPEPVVQSKEPEYIRIEPEVKQEPVPSHSPSPEIVVEKKTEDLPKTYLASFGQREKNWIFIFIAAMSMFAVAVLVQIFQKNIITTVFFGLLGVVIILRARKYQSPGDLEINHAGVRISDRTYEYREIKSFWIDYDSKNNIKELSLQLKKWYSPYIKIPIADENPIQIRSILVEYLTETEHEDSLSDSISRKLGI